MRCYFTFANVCMSVRLICWAIFWDFKSKRFELETFGTKIARSTTWARTSRPTKAVHVFEVCGFLFYRWQPKWGKYGSPPTQSSLVSTQQRKFSAGGVGWLLSLVPTCGKLGKSCKVKPGRKSIDRLNRWRLLERRFCRSRRSQGRRRGFRCRRRRRFRSRCPLCRWRWWGQSPVQNQTCNLMDVWNHQNIITK